MGSRRKESTNRHEPEPQTHKRRTWSFFFTFGPLEIIQGNLGAQVCPLTCEARRADAGVATNQVHARGIVQAGGRHALIYVDFTAGPCDGVTFRNKERNEKHPHSGHAAASIRVPRAQFASKV